MKSRIYSSDVKNIIKGTDLDSGVHFHCLLYCVSCVSAAEYGHDHQ